MDSPTEQFRESFRREVIPSWYSGWLHVGFVAILTLATCLLLLRELETLTFSQAMILPAMMILGNIAVFFIHKFPLHRKLFLFGFSYRIHTLWHHRFFTHESVTFDSSRDFYIVFFPVGFSLALCLLLDPLLVYGFAECGLKNEGVLFALGATLYFMLYEVFHFISHLKDDSFILKLPFFRFMRNHHRIHHDPALMASKNFNLVHPLSDMLFGTYQKYSSWNTERLSQE